MSVALATIKTILKINTADTEYDALITILIPIIEDIIVKYCGVSSIDDLSTGVVFPTAGLIKYAMENPMGVSGQTVGSDRTDYGSFPLNLLKILDSFKPDTTGGYVDAHSINLTDINDDLGL